MSFDYKYPNRKDWRKPHRRAKAVSHQCRNNGKCSYCKGNRTYSSNKRRQEAEYNEEEFLKPNHKNK
jgi:hypothetical protein